MNQTIKLLWGGIALFTLLAFVPARSEAQLLFSTPLTPYILNVDPGSTVDFIAMLENTTFGNVYPAAFDPGLTAPNLTINDLFFTNVPDTLTSGINTYTLFQVQADLSAVPGDYNGVAHIEYDTDSESGLSVAKAYTIHVNTSSSSGVPEPATCALLTLGILGFVRTRRK